MLSGAYEEKAERCRCATIQGKYISDNVDLMKVDVFSKLCQRLK